MFSAVATVTASSASSSASTHRFHGVEDRFIENWARLAESIGMDEGLGRVHAVLYLGSAPLTARAVAEYLELDENECALHLQTLVAFGGAHEVDATSGDAAYEAERDPWSWFMATIRERARREFAPLITSIRAVNTLAQEAKSAQSVRLDPERQARLERISRFTSFIDQISGLVETATTLGVAPLMATMRLASKFVR
jgi:DNA-binding transcriptional regulator GbsR (MarR family)